MRWVFRLLAAIVVVSIALLAGVRWLIDHQGAPAEDSESRGTKVSSDREGISTIRAVSFIDAVEAQGHLVASERMFQMDLNRRYGAGRLAELFGVAALPQDEKRRREDWIGAARRAEKDLPADERALCDAYAEGVNRFIRDHPGRWGIEYLLLRTEPEPWSCADTMLVLMAMIEQLSGSSPRDAVRGAWRDAIGERWYRFLFTQDHPWNQPLFGTPERPGPDLPVEEALPETPLGANEGRSARREIEIEGAAEGIGSNSWAWCGETGCFLANDPHLGHSVPQVWFALRFEQEDRISAGVSLPGIPGLVLGMNSELAWAFTNVGEDVDDLLIEPSPPPIVRTVTSTIIVKNGAPIHVTARFSPRGPIEERPWVKGPSSRRWLAFEPGMLRLPSKLISSKSWGELNEALDEMRVPAQNVLMVDRRGNVGYRTSGTGILRRADGQIPQPAETGDWIGFEPSSSRPRMLLTSTSAKTRFIATANERMWISKHGHGWADDARKDRIRAVLSGSDRLRQEDMYALQLDTHSRFHDLLLDWVAQHARAKGDEDRRLLERWRSFSGEARDDREVFGQALAIEAALQSSLVDRVRKRFSVSVDLPYDHYLSRAWMIRVLEAEGGTRVFGLTEGELADRLLEIGAAVKEPYDAQNRWESQHPFVGRVPFAGSVFAVSTPAQLGSRHLVRVELPKRGASVRMVWNLSEPMKSRWSFPVGQSGHVGSRHYDDARSDWFAEKPQLVFPPR
jgi:penicillin G amidase